jgi:hypothetical protein
MPWVYPRTDHGMMTRTGLTGDGMPVSGANRLSFAFARTVAGFAQPSFLRRLKSHPNRPATRPANHPKGPMSVQFPRLAQSSRSSGGFVTVHSHPSPADRVSLEGRTSVSRSPQGCATAPRYRSARDRPWSATRTTTSPARCDGSFALAVLPCEPAVFRSSLCARGRP